MKRLVELEIAIPLLAFAATFLAACVSVASLMTFFSKRDERKAALGARKQTIDDAIKQVEEMEDILDQHVKDYIVLRNEVEQHIKPDIAELKARLNNGTR